ncbi:MAG TPA: sugar phosphate isomerase/epimerase [Clostridiaceae bacterium]
MSTPIGIQLYTLKDIIYDDFIGTLEKVAAIGYEGVEFAGYGDIPAETMKATLDRLSLKACGSHVSYELLTTDLDAVIKYNKVIENPYVICPYCKFADKEDVLKKAKEFNFIGKELKKHGIQFGYHNHNHEFEKIDGEFILDILYKETDPEFLKAEIDLYWLYYMGVSTVDYIKKYSGRVNLIHLKDMEIEADGSKNSTEIGNGVINIKEISEAAIENKVEWLIVEQEAFKIPSLEAAKIDYDNIIKMGLNK